MKVAQLSLPLSAIVVIGLNQSALAGPQSMLDPYAHVKPPTKKSTTARKPGAAARPAAPTSVVISGPDLPPLPKEKKAKEKPIAIKSTPAPEPVVTKSPAPEAAVAGAPLDGGKSTAGGGEGFIAGTKQIFQGFATATKGAVVAPTRAMLNGTRKVADGTKSLGGKVADGTKSGGGFFVKGAKAVGGGFKAMGGKIKDGTVAVGEKVGGGIKVAAEKTKEGAGAVVSAPKALVAGGGEKKPAEKIAEAPGKPLPPATPIVGNEKPTPIGEVEGGESLGGKVLAMPKNAGRAVVGAAAKTGEVTKKMATAPIGFFGKLNPFKKNAPAIPAVQTAGTPKAGTPAR